MRFDHFHRAAPVTAQRTEPITMLAATRAVTAAERTLDMVAGRRIVVSAVEWGPALTCRCAPVGAYAATFLP